MEVAAVVVVVGASVVLVAKVDVLVVGGWVVMVVVVGSWLHWSTATVFSEKRLPGSTTTLAASNSLLSIATSASTPGAPYGTWGIPFEPVAV